MPKRKVSGPQMLVEAAARLFESKGYQNTTIDDIANAVGIAKPTVYQYIKSKGWLLESVFERLLARMKSDIDKVLAFEDPEEQLRFLVGYFMESIHDLQPYFLIFFGEERELPARTQKHFRAWARETTQSIVDIFERARDRGVIRPDIDPEIAAFMFIGMMSSTARWYDPRGRLTPEAIAEEALKMLDLYRVDRTQARGAKVSRVHAS
jgi:AcrR family transcriptional regulator